MENTLSRSALEVEIMQAAAAMGWLRCVGSLKLQVSFAEYGLFFRALLQKRPMILRRSCKQRQLWGAYDYGVATLVGS